MQDGRITMSDKTDDEVYDIADEAELWMTREFTMESWGLLIRALHELRRRGLQARRPDTTRSPPRHGSLQG
jgi:hypothetical protein